MNDETIVGGLRCRNKDAFRAFWDIYYERIYPICASILESGPDARDITVDILVDFIENRADSLTSSKALYAFLKQAAVRRSIRFRDRQKKLSPMESDERVCDDATPEEKAELNMLMPYLRQCLESLSPKVQAALRLKYARKISNEQIGDIVGGSKSYIGRLLKQGPETLRRCIERKVRQTAKSDRLGERWTPTPEPVVSLHTVEALLAKRDFQVEDDCDAVFRMVETLQEGVSEQDLAWADSHLAVCAPCRRALLVLQTVDAGEEPIDMAGGKSRRTSTERYSGWKKLSAVAAVVLMLSAVYFINDLGNRGVADSQLTPKGQADGFYVAVKRGGESFTLRPMDKLERGDKLGLFYSTETAGYLTVLTMDGAGKVTLLYPAGGEKTSVPVPVASRSPLRDGAIVGDGEGCEWLLAVFSSRPLALEHAISAVEASKNGSGTRDCRLNPVVPGARSVRVLPVKR